MADVLPSYRFDKRTGQYHSDATGRFVGRKTIISLMKSHVDAAAGRFAELTTAFYEGRLEAAAWIEQVRGEQRRLTLQSAALGFGGWDRLTSVQFGRAGSDLRDQYAKIAGTAQDIADGKITLAQALARVNEYVGAAKAHFWQAERETVQRSHSGVIVIERRTLGAGGKSCKDCLEFYEQGWQPMGVLPPPCTDSVCRGNCQCQLVRKEIAATDIGEWIGSKR